MEPQAYKLVTNAEAWEFMRACDEAGIAAGYPSIDGTNTVLTEPVPLADKIFEDYTNEK